MHDLAAGSGHQARRMRRISVDRHPPLALPIDQQALVARRPLEIVCERPLPDIERALHAYRLAGRRIVSA